MNESGSVLWRSLVGIAGAVGSFVLWTIWLALALLLTLQLYILSTNELAVPKFVLQELEQRLAASGLRATFSRTSLDPTGRVLVENARLSMTEFPEPIIKARAIYVRFNLWMLSVGRLEPTEIRIIDASATVPTMLTGSGAPEELVSNLDATLQFAEHELLVQQLSSRVANLIVTARGAVPLPRRRGEVDSRAMIQILRRQFPEYCRQAMAAAKHLQNLEQPVLAVELAPSESGSPAANVRLLTRRVKLEQPLALEASMVEATTRVLFLDGPTISRVELSARDCHVRSQAAIESLRAVAYGRLESRGLNFEPRSLELTADAVSGFGTSLHAVSALLFPRPFPRADGFVAMNFMGQPLGMQLETDVAKRNAVLRLSGALSPGVLTPISERLRLNVRQYFDFATLDCSTAEVRLADGWNFERASATVALTGINAYGVSMESGHAVVEFDGRRFFSPEAFARMGANFARGSFEQDLRTRAYRFLLQGRLRPMDISGWFRDWWSGFFQQLQFPAVPPTASVDVAGTWGNSRLTSVFVFGDAPSAIVRGVAFDHVRTRIFIRPSHFDGLEVLTRRGAGAARGTFTLRTNPETHDWSTLELKADSSHELGLIAQAMQPLGATLFSAFQITGAPELRVQARFDGPGAAERHQKVRIEAQTAGEFRFHEFPLQDVSFTAVLNDDDLVVDRLDARFGGGTANAHARLSGPEKQQRLGFDFNLKNANLGEVAASLEQFFAHQQGRPPGAPGKFVQQKANVRLDIGASAEGQYADPFSYKGGGNVVLQGAEIGEVPLLGALSELFTFTALRFTSARANFKVDGKKLVFPEIALRGDNSAVDAHGEYWLDRRELDFNAKVFPFQESGNLIKSVVGAVLTPLSNALEVKLTGTLQKPQWAFVLGPTNFLRSLAPEGHDPRPRPPESDKPAGAETKPSSPPAASPPGQPIPAPPSPHPTP
ncbi:MAG: AsmA-like C-terminal region-containing protein [Opitutaceae bacterium]|nr:AsmA-like C-terminal region-containing protein [Opitutaceae bacterium]